MAKFYRVKNPGIAALGLAKRNVGLADNQEWYETPKAYEIWSSGPFPRRLKRFSKSCVLFVFTKWGA